MSGLAIHTVDSAPRAVKDILREVKHDLGLASNLYDPLANARTVLEAYNDSRQDPRAQLTHSHPAPGHCERAGLRASLAS